MPKYIFVLLLCFQPITSVSMTEEHYKKGVGVCCVISSLFCYGVRNKLKRNNPELLQQNPDVNTPPIQKILDTPEAKCQVAALLAKQKHEMAKLIEQKTLGYTQAFDENDLEIKTLKDVHKFRVTLLQDDIISTEQAALIKKLARCSYIGALCTLGALGAFAPTRP